MFAGCHVEFPRAAIYFMFWAELWICNCNFKETMPSGILRIFLEERNYLRSDMGLATVWLGDLLWVSHFKQIFRQLQANSWVKMWHFKNTNSSRFAHQKEFYGRDLWSLMFSFCSLLLLMGIILYEAWALA